MSASTRAGRLLVALLAPPLALAAPLAACGGDGGSAPEPTAESLRVAPDAPSLRIGETVQLQAAAVDASGAAAALPAGVAVAWASDDTTIVVVGATGEARAVRPGTATLRATAGSLTGTTSVAVRAPTPQLATAARVSARIGRDGGTLAATSGGRRYVLTVPRDALLDSVEVALTPLAGMTDLPAGATLLAGADFAPSGLRFLLPATLRVEGVAVGGAGGRRVAGAAYEGSGASLRRAPLGVRGDTLTFLVPHFSGSAALDVPSVAEVPLPPRPGLDDPYMWRLSGHLEEWRFDPTYRIADSAAAVLRAWYLERVRPALAAAESDTSMLTAFASYATWQDVLDCGGHAPCTNSLGVSRPGVGFWPDAATPIIHATLSASVADLFVRLESALTRVVDADIAECRTTPDVQRSLRLVRNARYWHKWRIVAGTTAGDPVPDCARVVLEAVSFPDAITGGVAAPLDVTAGISFGGRAPTHDFNLDVLVSASGAAPAADTGKTDAATGRASIPFTPDGDEPVVLGVRAVWPHDHLGDVLKADTLVERQLGVSVALTPTAAILDPGASATFTAAVTGTTDPAVTWTATGGTVATSGNTLTYTAGATPGTYAVTARSVANPTRSATATITIVGAPVGRGRVVLDELGAAAQARNFLGGKGETCLVGDGVDQGTTFPLVRVFSAPCASAAVSDSGVAMSASATGGGRYELTLAGGALTRLATSGTAAASFTGGPPDAGGNARAQMTFIVHFEVVDGPVDLVMRGALDVDIPDAASNTEAGGLLSLFAKDRLVSLRLVRSGRTARSDPVLPAASLDATVRLVPGRYYLSLDANANANVAGGTFARAGGGYGISIDVVPVP